MTSALSPNLASAAGAPPGDATIVEAPWQLVLKRAIRDPVELCRRLRLPTALDEAARRAARDFGVFVPEPYLARIRPSDPADPLLLQVLPQAVEMDSPPGFSADPVGDRAAQRQPGLLRKYTARALMLTTGACAVHCRYCFRRHFPYSEGPRSIDAWQAALEEIAADANLREVILSGGDPLTLVDSQLAKLARRLAAIPHLTRLRIHTRLPIMIPSRVDDALLGWLRLTRLVPIVVIHANHAAELDRHVAAAVGRLVDAGVPVLNQTVLLRGVNDSAEALVALSERLLEMRALPYYLHQLDRVAGAAHFEVPPEQGRAIVAQLRRRLPGYAVPRYVVEVAGAPSKVPLELAEDEHVSLE